ncbi:unnamed protein product [Prorocentrum cordatum]|uniref:Glycerophosphocholine acyltransferase 1 n=1 Tax=Prorocentrum cordatum TaxID=2364126 RepID=A0ABN9X8Y0_9DINO|nr:unnamed protein product [Polarella glacialis]
MRTGAGARELQAPLASHRASVVPEGLALGQTSPAEPPAAAPDPEDSEPSACQAFLKEKCFWLFYVLCCIGCGISLVVAKTQCPHHFNRLLKLESIPIVSVLFTWGHIWLAVQMMFYPVKFWGCWNYKNSGYGLGWQGVVPRKAGKMAETTCELMLGRIITMEEVVDRIYMDDFFATFESVLIECQRKVNDRLGAQFFPSLWTRIPQSVKDELLDKVMECSKDSFHPIMSDVRRNIKSILDIKDMAVTRYTNEPRLLIGLFQKVGSKEFAFIQRTGAQMGLFLGLGQMALYFVTEKVRWMPWVLLPVSGLVIGNFTNWLAIKMIFKPTYPHLLCGGRLNIQGLFLKRQKVVCKVLARMLVDMCLNSDEMVKYLVSSPGYEGALEIFHKHAAKACDEVVGTARFVAPIVVGSDRYEALRQCTAGGPAGGAAEVQVRLQRVHGRGVSDRGDDRLQAGTAATRSIRGHAPPGLPGGRVDAGSARRRAGRRRRPLPGRRARLLRRVARPPSLREPRPTSAGVLRGVDA